MSLIKLPLREYIKRSELVAGEPRPGSRIRAANDAEAIERWLDEYFLKPTTFRTYKKEAERFLVWCASVRNTTLARLDRQDVDAYMEFLKDPKPREIWCGPRRKKNKGNDSTWYPFAGPLGPSAINAALTILNSLMSYLADARYVDFNPFALVRKKNRFKDTVAEQVFAVHERILSPEEWHAMRQALEEQSENSPEDIFKKHRLRFLVACLYFLGLRLDEMAKACWRDCQKLNGKWWFFVRGKGDRLGKIPINTQLLHAIMVYRQFLQKPPLPEHAEEGSLIASINDMQQPLTARHISNLIKSLAKHAAEKFEKGSLSYEKLLKFSPHWLRHLSASKQDLAGISFTNIKSNLRHSNQQTTRLYVHAYDDDRHEQMEKLKY